MDQRVSEVSSGAAEAVVTAQEAEEAVPRARELGGERALALLLRAGGMLGGACFMASLSLRLLPETQTVHVAMDLLQKGGASFLIATPVARLGVAGALLGLRGEYRYAAYAVISLGLLALALGAGYVA